MSEPDRKRIGLEEFLEEFRALLNEVYDATPYAERNVPPPEKSTLRLADKAERVLRAFVEHGVKIHGEAYYGDVLAWMERPINEEPERGR